MNGGAASAEEGRRNRRATIGVLALSAAILIFASLPHLLGFLTAPEGIRYTGTLANNLDQISYYAKMRQGYDGSWRYTNRYTTENSSPAFLFFFYLLLGHAARWIGLSLIATYNLARVLCGSLLLFAVDRLIRRLGLSGGRRLMSFAIVFFAGGLCWLYGSDPASRPIEQRPMEYWVIEGYSFQSIAYYPHFALSTAMIVLIMTEFLRLAAGGAKEWSLIRVAVFSFLLGWLHPRLLLTVLAVAAIAGGLDRIRRRSDLLPWLRGIGAILAGGALPACLILDSIWNDPDWKQTAQPVMLTPLPGYALGYGMLWILAAWGVARKWRLRDPRWDFMAAWLGIGALLPFVPIDSQRRLIQGLNIPLGICSAMTVSAMLAVKGSHWISRACRAGAGIFCVALFLPTAMFLFRECRKTLGHKYPSCYSIARGNAMEWLNHMSLRDEVVLCSSQSGVLIPAFAGNRVISGHWAETYQGRAKIGVIKQFFNAKTPGEEREAILERFFVRYLLMSPFERTLGAYDPGKEPVLWKPVWSENEIVLYERIAQ